MAAGNPNFDAILSTTLANYRKQFSDNLSRSFFLYYWLTMKGRKRTENGGESIVVQLMYGSNSTVKSYSGYEPIDVTPQEGLTSAKYPWKQVAGTVSISGLEKRKNSGESRIINLLQSKVAQLEISFRDKMNGMFFGDGTGNGSRDIFGLQLLVEDGTAWGTLAGIDRSDALNTWWRNQWKDLNGAWGTATTAGGYLMLLQLYNLCSRGNEHPDIIISPVGPFESYEIGLTPQERFTNEAVADIGFQNVKYKGAVWGYDEQCPAQTLYALNSNYIEWVADSEYDMKNEEFQTPIGQDASVAKVLTMGNLVLSNSARQGVMTRITG